MVVVLQQSTTVSRLFFGEMQEKTGGRYNVTALQRVLQSAAYLVHSLLRLSLSPCLLLSGSPLQPLMNTGGFPTKQ